ncbi:hypothetical protein J6590_012326 [Homalodisca vitripennis]|nr:hypothetical protein J6590_012326 [Homalodisca vitripennis]
MIMYLPYRNVANLFPKGAVCKIMALCLIHNVLATGEPRYIGERLQYRGEVAECNTRQDENFYCPKVKLEGITLALKRTFAIGSGVKEYSGWVMLEVAWLGLLLSKSYEEGYSVLYLSLVTLVEALIQPNQVKRAGTALPHI